MAGMASDIGHEAGDLGLFRNLEQYPWDSDKEFRNGLSAILGQNSTLEQVQYLTLKARCFYYSRKYDTPVDFAAYQSWRSKNAASREETLSESLQEQPSSIEPHSKTGHSSSHDTLQPSPPYPMTFNHIVELITSGEPIPGIKSIPDKVLEGQASESTKARRKKPWEAGGGISDETAKAANVR